MSTMYEIDGPLQPAQLKLALHIQAWASLVNLFFLLQIDGDRVKMQSCA
jgi:hypothetical protein